MRLAWILIIMFAASPLRGSEDGLFRTEKAVYFALQGMDYATSEAIFSMDYGEKNTIPKLYAEKPFAHEAANMALMILQNKLFNWIHERNRYAAYIALAVAVMLRGRMVVKNFGRLR